MHKKLTSIIVLSVICIVITLLLSVINTFTQPKIEFNQAKKEKEAREAIMPDGAPFEKVDDTVDLPDSVISAYSSANGGYVFTVKTNGFGTGLIVMCGINADGKITGMETIKSNETYGAESDLNRLFADKMITDYESVPVVSGATLTRNAYGSAISDAFEAFNILRGEATEND